MCNPWSCQFFGQTKPECLNYRRIPKYWHNHKNTKNVHAWLAQHPQQNPIQWLEGWARAMATWCAQGNGNALHIAWLVAPMGACCGSHCAPCWGAHCAKTNGRFPTKNILCLHGALMFASKKICVAMLQLKF